MKEIIEKVLGMIPYFKTKAELLDEEFDRFDSRYLPKEEYFTYAKTVFEAYITDLEFRNILDSGQLFSLNVSAYGEAYKKLPDDFRRKIPEYIKENVALEKFAG
jgi:type I restriction enzyme R subunit